MYSPSHMAPIPIMYSPIWPPSPPYGLHPHNVFTLPYGPHPHNVFTLPYGSLFIWLGFQVISVEGPHDQCLKLVQPLPLGRKPSSQWMRALETAVAHSLACQFTECQAAMPGGLFSQLAGTEPEGELQACVYLHLLSNDAFFFIPPTQLSQSPHHSIHHHPSPHHSSSPNHSISSPNHFIHHSIPSLHPSLLVTITICQNNRCLFKAMVEWSLNSISCHGYSCHLGPGHTECSDHAEQITDC